MKKFFITILFICVLQFFSYAQYFQGTFTNTGNTLIFKMKPTADLNVSISYLELSFRYSTASTPPFSTTNLVNGSAFPGLNMQKRIDFVLGGFTYVRYVHNTSTIAAFNYLASNSAGYEIMRINLSGPNSVANFEMTSDLVAPANDYVFGVIRGDGSLIDPGAGNQLYGPGFNIQGNLHLLPLNAVAVPVKFLSFTATKKGVDAELNWAVDNEGAITERYEVQRSINGRDYTTQYTVSPKLNGNSSNDYLQVDRDIINSFRSNSVFFYRIKQIDKDGQFVYSETRKIAESKAGTINLFPNPVKDKTVLTLDLELDGIFSVRIIDAAGKSIINSRVNGRKGFNTYNIDLKGYASGKYNVIVNAGEFTKDIKIIKVD